MLFTHGINSSYSKMTENRSGKAQRDYPAPSHIRQPCLSETLEPQENSRIPTGIRQLSAAMAGAVGSCGIRCRWRELKAQEMAFPREILTRFGGEDVRPSVLTAGYRKGRVS